MITRHIWFLLTCYISLPIISVERQSENAVHKEIAYRDLLQNKQVAGIFLLSAFAAVESVRYRKESQKTGIKAQRFSPISHKTICEELKKRVRLCTTRSLFYGGWSLSFMCLGCTMLFSANDSLSTQLRQSADAPASANSFLLKTTEDTSVPKTP
jgi:hypothetical protein